MPALSSERTMLSGVLFYPWITLFVFLILGSLLYLNALDNPFQYDDSEVVVENRNIRDTANILSFFEDPGLSANDPKVAGHYRPLVISSYAINYAFGGLSPVGYHLVNLI
ncbi:MAG: hypothetical protein IT393_02315, partial [Nitrospirae bacterium]|nr:hypothetical protein [Nitrospirota bacterium]